MKGEALVVKAIGENVRVQLHNLQTHQTVVERISWGQVKLHGWLYNYDSRGIWFLDDLTGTYLPFADLPPT